MTEATAVQTRDTSRVTPAAGSVRALLMSTEVQKRFEQVLGDAHKAAMFVSALSTLVYANRNLQQCNPNTVIAAALDAAALDLPVTPSLGLAHIIPYGSEARFIPGWRAYVQLAHRTGQYAKINVTEVYEGEIRGTNRLTGDLQWGDATSDKIVGYAAYFRLTNGFEKSLYMTVEKIDAHGKRYAPMYGRANSKWQSDFPDMARKTVLKQLLTKWGPLSIEIHTALAADTPPDEPELDASAASDANRRALFGDEPEPQAHAPLEQEVAQAPAKQPDNAALDKAVVEADAKQGKLPIGKGK